MPTLTARLVRLCLNALGLKEPDGTTAAVEAPARPPRLTVAPEYRSLHKYLDDRFAGTVVLTFGQIEDLLGSALPDPARVQSEWWTTPDSRNAPSAHSRAWTQARRTARPNLRAQTVVFERAPA